MGKLAILSGAGGLPHRLAALNPDAVQISFSGVAHDLGEGTQEHRFEAMGALFDALKSQDVSEVVMAGAMSRPPLDPAAFDPVMRALEPRLIAAMQGGDDALLRFVISVFEDQGFRVRGAHELDPSLAPEAGVLAGQALSTSAQADADRAIAILHALSPLDVGQGAVVENGLCLGVKAPKQGQDLRVDMPTIGPETVRAAASSGLSAILVAAGAVIVLERKKTISLAEAAGISLTAQDI